ncbi:MAG: colicin uptake protein TolR [Deltaproteobacteria bacterium ADurb.Bin510]|nr:MAG: colicin uptake protein TolR [Deltaproteobacteria bacterium ADurb.Bin510]
MRIPRSEEMDDNPIQMTSLMDLMFILLIFYVATATFRKDEVDLNLKLPETSLQSTISAASKQLIINVRAPASADKQQYYVVYGKAMDLEQLTAMVKGEVKKDAKQKVLVRGDRSAFHGQVAAALAACKKAGVDEANIGYDSKPIPSN